MTRTEKMTKLVESEIREQKFIDHSDLTDRIIDNFAKTLSDEDETMFNELVETAENYLNENYNKVSNLDESGYYTCYYSIEKFSSIEELENYFNLGE